MLNAIFKFMYFAFAFIFVLVILSGAFLYVAPTFGAKPSGVSVERINRSKQFKNGEFVNSVPTKLSTREAGDSMDIATYLFPADDKNPKSPLPTLAFDKAQFSSGDFVWFGHSTLMFRTDALTVLTDPVFHRASPVPIGGKPFPMSTMPNAEMLPDIDVVIISHDHYDHLDHRSIGELVTRVRLFLVPLGIRDHLLRWGVPDANILEMDWFDEHTMGNTVFTLTPARHFSGRGLTNRNSTLWGSWVVQNEAMSVFYGGDSGYFEGFTSIGEQFGPFDIAFLENGAYDKQWAEIHMQPEESVQAALDLNTRVYFPIHWGKYDLAKHRWSEPIERAVRIAEEKNLPIAAPLIGQVFQLDQPPFETWWVIE